LKETVKGGDHQRCSSEDRVVFMDEGQIVDEGTAENFFTNPVHDRTKFFLSQIL